MEDALVVGTLLNTLIRNADRVKMACLAQLVNVIAPIMTVPGGGLWLQTIYWPFLHASIHGRGTSLAPQIEVGSYAAGDKKVVPWLDSSAVLAEDENSLTVFAVNRSLDESMELDLALSGFEGFRLIAHTELSHSDLKATNSASDTDRVSPKEVSLPSGSSAPQLAPASWNVLRFGK